MCVWVCIAVQHFYNDNPSKRRRCCWLFFHFILFAAVLVCSCRTSRIAINIIKCQWLLLNALTTCITAQYTYTRTYTHTIVKNYRRTENREPVYFVLSLEPESRWEQPQPREYDMAAMRATTRRREREKNTHQIIRNIMKWAFVCSSISTSDSTSTAMTAATTAAAAAENAIERK